MVRVEANACSSHSMHCVPDPMNEAFALQAQAPATCQSLVALEVMCVLIDLTASLVTYHCPTS